jgi:5-methylcytosine-specific restriction protein A
MAGGWVDRKTLSRGLNGRGLCRWCSLEVPHGRFTFCSAYCVHEWRRRTQPAYIREPVFLRDHGVFASCKLDTVAARRHLRYARGAKRDHLLRHWGMTKRIRKSLWDADHILPVAEGGGECDLENLRTLCLLCHRAETARLIEKRRFNRFAGDSRLGVGAN